MSRKSLTVFEGRRRGLWRACLCAVLLISCGGDNYLKHASSKNSDEALYQDVLKLVDAQNYNEALVVLARMTPEGQARDDVVLTKAGIYAGKCGLNFLDFVDRLDSSGSPFHLFKSGFDGGPANIAFCQTAQNLIETFGKTGVHRLSRLGAAKGNNANTFMAVLGMTKIGVQLSMKEDADRDGVAENAYDACQDLTTGKGGEVSQIGTGFALVLDNFASIAANLTGATADLLEDLQSQCEDVGVGSTNPCSITDVNDPLWDVTDPADYSKTPTIVATVIRSLVRSQSVGVQNCASGPAVPLPPPLDSVSIYPLSCCLPALPPLPGP